MKTYNTDVETKKKYFPVFMELIKNQFWHGGEKYKLEGQQGKEATDFVCEISPGKTGADWVLQTMVKYIFRFLNFRREKDLLKISTYCFIMWLKMGYHLEKSHDEDIKKEG